jgi:hypothetical protein
MPQVFRSIMKKYNLAPGDFPDIEDFKSKLRESDFSKFHSLKMKLVEDAEQCLSMDFPRLMEALPRANDGGLASAPAAPRVDGPLTFAPAASAAAAAVVGSSPFDDDDNNPWGEEEGENRTQLML